MTDAAIQALIDAARTSPSDLVTWDELKAILEGLKSQTTLSDLSPATNQIPKWNGSAWVAANDATADAGTGVDNNATITSNRTWTMGNNKIVLKNNSANTNPPLEFETDISANNSLTYLKIKSPTGTTSGRDWGIYQSVTQNATAIPADPNSYNEVIKMGFNPDRAWEPTKNGFWDAWEPHWLSGDALYLERHISVNMEAFPGEKRLYSILAIPRTSWAAADIIHLWQGSSYNFQRTTGSDLMTLSPIGSNGFKMTMISPAVSAFVYEMNGVNNVMEFYPTENDGVFDAANANWLEWRFGATRIKVTLTTYASNAAAISGGLSAGNLYTDGSGNVKIVT